MSADPETSIVHRAILGLAERRAPKSFCPSEVARALADDWRPLMVVVRQAAADLVTQGLIVCTRGGEPCDPLGTGGPIRLSRGAHRPRDEDQATSVEPRA